MGVGLGTYNGQVCVYARECNYVYVYVFMCMPNKLFTLTSHDPPGQCRVSCAAYPSSHFVYKISWA